jgi:putative ABC transport system permease protein
VDKDLALTEVRTLDEVAAQSVARPRLRAALAAAFALAALALAALGVYGVLAFTVAQRVREFGIRMALGARGEDVLTLVLGGGLRIAVGGTIVGLAAAAALTQSLGSMLFGVQPLDPVTFVAVPLMLTVVAMVACAIPARRAMVVDPAIALRDE